MRSTSKDQKNQFYSKNSNYNNYNSNNSNNNSKSLLKIPNFSNNLGYNKQPNNFQTLIQQRDFKGLNSKNNNIPIKLNEFSNSNTPYKVIENSNPSYPYGSNFNNNESAITNFSKNPPNLPLINKNMNPINNSNYISNNYKESSSNINHSRYNSSISNNSNLNINPNINNSGSNIKYGHDYQNTYNIKPIISNFNNISNNNINLNSSGLKNKENGNYNVNGGNSEKRSSSKHVTNLSNYDNIDSLISLKTPDNYSNSINKENILSSNYTSSYNLDTSTGRNRPLSRNQSNTNIYKKENINNYESNNYNTNKMDISKKLIGLRNLGNTCFMNTSLQCILHCDAFINRFVEFCENKKTFRPTPISNSLLNLIENYSKTSDKAAISPEELKSAIGKKHRIYSGFSQQDSQEFIRKLLDEISQELNLITEKKPYKMLNSNNEQENKRELNIEYDKIFRDRESSIIVDTFNGQSISIFQCSECNYESYSFEKFLDIPLLLEETYNDQDLSKLLGKYFENENIQWESPCTNKSCKKKSMHRKKLKLSVLPDILILSLQRYNNRLRRKNNCRVSFKNEIDLMEYTDSSCLMRKKLKIILFYHNIF